jgi:cellobiose transport system permease protein
LGGKEGWAGLDNYSTLLHDDNFWNALVNTLGIFLLATIPQLLCALGLAQLLNERLRARTFWRMGVLLPNITSVAAVGIIFTLLFARDFGLVNWLLGFVGVEPIAWQDHRWSSWLAISVMVDWRWTGYNALIYLAGMQSIDSTLYEAAAVDGAGRWRQFLHVTLPGLRPTILFTIVVSTIGATQLFGEPLLYHNGKADGGTEGQYQTLGVLMYQQGWVNDRLGLASATAWTMFVIIVIAVAVNLLVARYRTREALRWRS